MSDTAFSLSRSVGDGVAVLTLTGEADIASAPQIRDALFGLAERMPVVVLDLAELSFVDSTALSVLVLAYKRMQAQGSAMRLVGLQPNVRRVFDITGLTGLFTIFDTTQQALSA